MRQLVVASLLLLYSCHSIAQSEWKEIDYSIDTNWAVLNGEFNKINGVFVQDTFVKGVDVFFVFPTLIADEKDARWNVEMSDQKWKDRVQSVSIKYQCSAYASAGRVYSPYYRQAHLRSYSMLEEGGREALLRAYNDVRAAFLYYLEHYNNGNGIILAGHSQGSTQLSLLLHEFFDNKELSKQLVAAYLPGVGLKPKEFESLPLMAQPDETGGFVTWNTFKWNYDIPQYNNWYKGSAVINPITWTSADTASYVCHKGFLYRNGKVYKNCIKTEMIDGGIRLKAPRFPHRYMSLFMKHYHIADINFFWEDIHSNSIFRAQQYLNKQINN